MQAQLAGTSVRVHDHTTGLVGAISAPPPGWQSYQGGIVPANDTVARAMGCFIYARTNPVFQSGVVFGGGGIPQFQGWMTFKQFDQGYFIRTYPAGDPRGYKNGDLAREEAASFNATVGKIAAAVGKAVAGATA